MPKKIADISRFSHDLAQRLNDAYNDPELSLQYAWWMLEATTGKSRASFLAEKSLELTDEQVQQIDEWVEKQVKRHEPLQYLIGSVPFAGTNILIEPPTLIPRAETEEWCAGLIEQLRQAGIEKLSILDLCTGSGCVAIALAKAFPQATVYAIDIQPTALALTQKNIVHNNVSNVVVLASDLFNALPVDTRFDLIVSNPPYVTYDEWAELEPTVTVWEDKMALVAADDGLEIIKKIITQAPAYLLTHSAVIEHGLPQLLIEIGHAQGKKVTQLMKAAGYNRVETLQDMGHRDRLVIGSFNHVVQQKT